MWLTNQGICQNSIALCKHLCSIITYKVLAEGKNLFSWNHFLQNQSHSSLYHDERKHCDRPISSFAAVRDNASNKFVSIVLVIVIANGSILQGGAESLAKGSDAAWALPLGAAVLSVRQIGLGGWDQRECMALENEIGCWQQEGNLDHKPNALR